MLFLSWRFLFRRHQLVFFWINFKLNFVQDKILSFLCLTRWRIKNALYKLILQTQRVLVKIRLFLEIISKYSGKVVGWKIILVTLSRRENMITKIDLFPSRVPSFSVILFYSIRVLTLSEHRMNLPFTFFN